MTETQMTTQTTTVPNYYEYITSKEWYLKTESIRERNGGICECCNMRFGTDVHHRTYEHLGNEKPEELIHLCRTCHEMVHGKKEGFIWPSRILILERLRKEIADEYAKSSART